MYWSRTKALLTSSSVLGVSDQILFSITGFFVNILASRSLTGNAFGEFAIAQSLFIFVVGVHNSFFLEPTVLRYISSNDRLKWNDIYFLLIGSLVIAAVCMAISIFIHNIYFSVYSFALIFISIYWSVRRILYALALRRFTFMMSIAYFISGGILLIAGLHFKIVWLLYLNIGLPSVFVCAMFFTAGRGLMYNEVAIFSFVGKIDIRFSGWVFLTTLVSWFPLNIVYYLPRMTLADKAGFKIFSLLLIPTFTIANGLVNGRLRTVIDRSKNSIKIGTLVLQGVAVSTIGFVLSPAILYLLGRNVATFSLLIEVFIYSVLFVVNNFLLNKFRLSGRASVESIYYGLNSILILPISLLFIATIEQMLVLINFAQLVGACYLYFMDRTDIYRKVE